MKQVLPAIFSVWGERYEPTRSKQPIAILRLWQHCICRCCTLSKRHACPPAASSMRCDDGQAQPAFALCRSPSPSKERHAARSEHGGAAHATHTDMTPKVRLEAEADRMLLTQQLLERVRPAQSKLLLICAAPIASRQQLLERMFCCSRLKELCTASTNPRLPAAERAAAGVGELWLAAGESWSTHRSASGSEGQQ